MMDAHKFFQKSYPDRVDLKKNEGKKPQFSYYNLCDFAEQYAKQKINEYKNSLES